MLHGDGNSKCAIVRGEKKAKEEKFHNDWVFMMPNAVVDTRQMLEV
jgi:hypothetical protein